MNKFIVALAAVLTVIGFILYASLVELSSPLIVENSQVTRTGALDFLIITASAEEIPNSSTSNTPPPSPTPTIIANTSTPTPVPTVTVTPTPTPTPYPTAIYNGNPQKSINASRFGIIEADWGKPDYYVGETAHAVFKVRNTGTETIRSVLIVLKVYKASVHSGQVEYDLVQTYGIPFEGINVAPGSTYEYTVNYKVPVNYNGEAAQGSYRLEAEVVGDAVDLGGVSGEYNLLGGTR